MMDELMTKFGILYQMIVLVAIIGLNGWYFAINGQLEETLTGALIGVMVSLPATVGKK